MASAGNDRPALMRQVRKDFAMKKYVTFTWLSCNCEGTETCFEEEFEEKKKFFKTVFGAYRFEIIHN